MKKTVYIGLVANTPAVGLPILDLVKQIYVQMFLVMFWDLKCAILALKNVFLHFF